MRDKALESGRNIVVLRGQEHVGLMRAEGASMIHRMDASLVAASRRLRVRSDNNIRACFAAILALLLPPKDILY